MVVPENMLEPVGNLSQNLFINAPTLSQLSACSAAFDCDDELGSHLRCYTHNRDILLKVGGVPSGAVGSATPRTGRRGRALKIVIGGRYNMQVFL